MEGTYRLHTYRPRFCEFQERKHFDVLIHSRFLPPLPPQRYYDPL